MINERESEFNNEVINRKCKLKYIITAIILVILGLITSGNKSLAEECTVGDVTYAYTLVDGNAENVYISAYKGRKPSKYAFERITLEIPSSLDGYNVVSVGNGVNTFIGNAPASYSGALSSRDCVADVKKIILPNTLKKINDYAFYFYRFAEKIEIPNGVQSIGEFAFANCCVYSSNQRDLVIPDSVETIGDYAFANLFARGAYDSNGYFKNNSANNMQWIIPPVGMRTITLGTGLKSIGKYAFAMQSYLHEVTIPENVNSIGEGAFTLSGIQTLNLSNRSATLSFGKYCFAGTQINHNVVIKSAYQMDEYVFARCNSLPSIEFENITEIPVGICYECKGLREVIKTRISTIKKDAFRGCTGLTTEQYNNIISDVQSIGDYAFSNCTGLTETIIIPSSLSDMGRSVFAGCSNVKNVTMNSRIKKIPDGTFNGCTSLTNEGYNNVMRRINKVGRYAFSNCKSLSGKIAVKDIVTDIEEGAFSGCSNIEEVEFNAKETDIGRYVFMDCTKLSKFTKSSTVTTIGNSAFENCIALTLDVLQNNIINGVRIIGSQAFKNCEGLEGSLIINKGIEEIGDEAFYNCTKIQELIFEERNNERKRISIGGKAFWNIAKSQEVVEVYGDETLYGVTATIDTRAFSNIKEIFIRNSIRQKTNLGYKFYGDSLVAPIIHYGDCKHIVDITCTLPGVKLVNPETNEEVTTKYVDCESDLSFKLVIDEAYKDKYKDLSVKLISEGRYSDSDYVEEDILDQIKSNADRVYTISNIIRDKKIIVQANKNGTDLVLRQYISQINGENIDENRSPSVDLLKDGVKTFGYNHTKYPILAKTGDKITYTIRVYNEGNTEGSANKIVVRLKDGLKYVSAGSTEGWSVSEDGRSITTEYLKSKKIASCPEDGRPEYEELTFVCEVGEQNDKNQYLVALAEIAEGNDIDSLHNSTEGIDLTDFMKEQAYNSSIDGYTKCIEDDTDFEAIELKAKINTGYNLVVNKIDSKSNELLNGAKICLLNENKEEIKTVITQNGKADFGEISSYGEGVDKYYIQEVETPPGYKRTIDGMVGLEVTKKINESGEVSIEILCEAQSLDEEDDFSADVDETMEFIPITTVEELSKIGSNEEVIVNGKTYTFAQNANYRLENDIVAGTFTPIKYMNGIFDGNNHTISELTINGNLWIYNGTSYEAYGEVGLFRVFSGEIRNLNIDLVEMRSAYDDDSNISVCGQPTAGVLVGYMESGVIKNCNIKGGRITGSTRNIGGFVGHTKAGEVVKFDNCSLNSEFGYSYSYNAGGFVGCALGEVIINNCSNNANVLISEFNAGGFIGCIQDTATIRNSNNNGNIQGKSNVGGIVGNTGKGSTLNVYNCNNNGVIGYEQTFSNVGGIVGFSEGIANIIGCSNTAEIVTTAYNAGGIIGHAVPMASVVNNTKVEFDSDSKTISVNIKNKHTDGNYKLQVLKADLTLNKSLSGAQFSVYNSDLDLIKENAEVDDNGILIIEDKKISSIASDVYYIKETKAPEGYEILVKDYIKVEIVKRWDGVNEKYIIDANPIIDVDENLNEVELKEDTTNTHTKHAGENIIYPNIRYKNNKTAIINCNNSGNISANKANAGGIAGVIEFTNLIENCHNTAEIMSPGGEAAGIVGDLLLYTYEDESVVKSCTNAAVITGKYIGGIVGASLMDVKIYNCENTADGKIADGFNAGGIIGQANTNAYIHDCINKADVQGSSTGGGIIGMSEEVWMDHNFANGKIVKSDDYLEIVNCKVMDANISGGNIGGIIGGTFGPKVYVEKCHVENIEASGEDATGILGTYACEEMTFKNNNVINSRINASGGQAAGIIGGEYYSFHHNRGSTYIDAFNIDIDECNVLGCTITGDIDAAGLVGHMWYGMSCDIYLDISGCNVGPDKDGNESRIEGKNKAAGIFAGLYIHSDKDVADIKIEKTSVDNTTIIADKNTRQAGAAGIVAVVQTSWASVDVGINECKVNNCTIEGGTPGGYNSGCATGILGIMYSSTSAENSKLYIKACDVTGTTINSASTDISGIAGYLYQAREVAIEDCNVDNLTINDDNYDDNKISDNIGGILSGAYTPNRGLKIDNCNVFGININVPSKNVGGIIGSIYSYDRIEASITNSKCDEYVDKNTNNKIQNNVTLYSETETLGGTIGSIMENVNMTFENVECSDFAISAANENDYIRNIGGIAGSCWTRSVYFKDVDVNNIDINKLCNTEEERTMSYGETFGGVCGVLVAADAETNNIKVENINVISNHGKMGGFAGVFMLNNQQSQITIGNTTLENIMIESNKSTIPNSLAGYIGASPYDSYSVENVSMNNIELNILEAEIVSSRAKNNSFDNSSIISGLIGTNGYSGKLYTDGYEPKISNVEINDIRMNGTVSNENPVQIINIAGLIGVNNTTLIDNVTINNATVNNDSACGSIGGIVSVVKEKKKCNIVNSSVNNFNATGRLATGGIIGVGTANISDCTITNPILTGNGRMSIVGGIAGISVEESNIDNVTVTAELQEGQTEPLTYGVFSDYLAAGLIAINSGRISNSTVENLVVKSTREETVVDEGEPVTDLMSSGPYAREIQVLSLQNFIDCVATNVKVICGTEE